MKKSLLISIIVLLGFVLTQLSPASSQAGTIPCWGQVVYTMPPEAGPGLAIMSAPKWENTQYMAWVHVGDRLPVTAIQFNQTYGDIWFQVPGGWVQSYGGYTTPDVYVVASWMEMSWFGGLPVYMGDWSWTD
jgi:hypothetical protein